MTSREVHVAAVARGDDDAKAGAEATVSGEETPAAPQRATTTLHRIRTPFWTTRTSYPITTHARSRSDSVTNAVRRASTPIRSTRERHARARDTHKAPNARLPRDGEIS